MDFEKCVKIPKEPIKKFRKHEWDDDFKDWMTNTALPLQQNHINNNADTLDFCTPRKNIDTLRLRICILRFGIKQSLKYNLQAYTKDEKNKIEPFIKKLKKECEGDIQFNVFYVIVGYRQVDNRYSSQEIPLLRLSRSKKIIALSDPECLYDSFDDYLKVNKLEKSVLLYPASATYAVEPEVELHVRESSSCGLDSDIQNVIETMTTVTSIALTVIPPLTALQGAAFMQQLASGSAFLTNGFQVVSKVAECGVLVVERLNKIKNVLNYTLKGINVCGKIQRNEMTTSELLKLMAPLLDKATGALTKHCTKKMKSLLQQKKSFDEISKELSKVEKSMLVLSRVVNVIKNVKVLTVSFYSLLTNPDRSINDVNSFCQHVFTLTNTLLSPWTVKQMLEDTEKPLLEEINKKSQSVMDKCMKVSKFVTRHYEQIETLTEFYNQLKKLQLTVTFNKNGIVLDYNNAVFIQKLEEIRMRCSRIENILNEVQKLLKTYNFVSSLVQDTHRFANNELSFDEYLDRFQAAESEQKAKEVTEKAECNKFMIEYSDVISSAERALCHGKTWEEWNSAEQDLIDEQQNNPQDEQIYNEQLEKIGHNRKRAEEIRILKNQFVSQVDSGVHVGEILKNIASNEYITELQNQGGSDFIQNSVQVFKDLKSLAVDKRITIPNNSAVAKNSLEQLYGVSNYKDIVVNGIEPFRDISKIDFSTICRYLQNPEVAKSAIDTSFELLKYINTTVNGESSNQFGDMIKLLEGYTSIVLRPTTGKKEVTLEQKCDFWLQIATGDDNAGKKVRTFLDDLKKCVDQCYKRNPEVIQYRNFMTAGISFLKNCNPEDIHSITAEQIEPFLVETMKTIQSDAPDNNIEDSVFSQNDTALDKVYLTSKPRRYFGSSSFTAKKTVM